ncbi:Bax inhibitor-1/YccA family protein [Sphingomonas ginkgonis]|nr:Bax inhibitor-1/YccA family protein [Sphingomonas ginkgonis]
MLSIYRHMGVGLLVTAAVALGVAATPPLAALIFGTPLKWVAMFAPLAFVMFMSFRFERMSSGQVRAAFYGFAAVMGVSMASLFLVFTGQSIALAFASAAVMFLGMSLWGYTTNRDLTRMGSFLMMGLLGIIVASLINLLVGSSALQLAVSLIGVVVFTGLTAWDTQRAKGEYLAYAGSGETEKLALFSALSLYLNLINLFQLLLSFMGQREE